MIRRIFSPRGNDFLVQDGYLHLQRKVYEIEVEGELNLDYTEKRTDTLYYFTPRNAPAKIYF